MKDKVSGPGNIDCCPRKVRGAFLQFTRVNGMLATVHNIPGQEILVYYDVTGDVLEFKVFLDEW